METLILNNISKTLSKRQILKNISFKMNDHEIAGFIGPNGAGKTTTMKVITDLLRPDEGTIRICGFDLKNQREKALEKCSAIIETPSLYNYLTGKEILQYISKIRGIKKERVEEIIDFTGLGERICDKVRKYSLGMKQRLALGICLLTAPALLLLDEPTNGLDPQGIIDLRVMLKKLKDQNGTSILVSSHNLSEIQKICDRFIFINDGKIISQKNNINTNIKTFRMEISDAEKVNKLFSERSDIEQFKIHNNNVQFSINNSKLSELLKELLNNNIDFTDFEQITWNIEQEYDWIYNREDLNCDH
ncbi:ATP-binding cassette domain-containing protein [[Clostridium] cellulosi]